MTSEGPNSLNFDGARLRTYLPTYQYRSPYSEAGFFETVRVDQRAMTKQLAALAFRRLSSNIREREVLGWAVHSVMDVRDATELELSREGAQAFLAPQADRHLATAGEQTQYAWGNELRFAGAEVIDAHGDVVLRSGISHVWWSHY